MDAVDRLLLPTRTCSWCHKENREDSHWPGLHDRCAQQSGAFLPRDRRRALSAPRSPDDRPLTILEEWGNRCWFCHRSLSRRAMTRDHLLPRSRGGDDRPANLRPACKACNTAKGAMTEPEFLDYCRRVVESELFMPHRDVCARVYAARLAA